MKPNALCQYYAKTPLGHAGAERGFVLVCVLWVVAIMTVVTLGFGRRAMLEHTAARYTLDNTKAMHMARAAVNRGIVELRNKAVYDVLDRLEGRTSYAQAWARPNNLLKTEDGGTQFFSITDEEDFENDIVAYVIRDEESLISLASADEELLSNVPGITRPVMRQINYRRQGRMRDNEPPQPFQTVEELRFIREINDDAWFGDDRTPGLRDMVSCFGNGQINVNTASLEVLQCIPRLGGVAGAIIEYRKGPDGELFTEDDRDFESMDDLADKLRITGRPMEALRKYGKTSSQFFTVTGMATRRQGKIQATCTATVMISGQHATIVKWREETLEP